MSSPISSGKEIFLIEILRRKNCQEGVVEVKEVLKDAVEHLPDGHRWVIYLKTIKLKIFQPFFYIVINSYALACACANSVSSFNTFKGRHSGSWILDPGWSPLFLWKMSSCVRHCPTQQNAFREGIPKEPIS